MFTSPARAKSNEELQAALLGEQPPAPTFVTAPPATPSVAPSTTLVEERPAKVIHKKSKFEKQIDRAITVMAYLFVLIMAAVLWLVGAAYTIAFCSTIGPIAKLGYAAWLLPAFITACELKLWPKRSTAPVLWAFWLAILAFDIGSSYAGFTTWGAGRTIALFGGFVLPESGTSLMVLGLVLSIIFAFGPEKLTRYALAELNKLLR